MAILRCVIGVDVGGASSGGEVVVVVVVVVMVVLVRYQRWHSRGAGAGDSL